MAIEESLEILAFMRCVGTMQGLTDDWRVRLAFPIFRLIDILLSRQRIARFLFKNFRTKDNLKKVLQVTAFATFMICMLMLLLVSAQFAGLCLQQTSTAGSGFGQEEGQSTSI